MNMNNHCTYNKGDDIFRVVEGNDFPIRICLWSKGLTFGQDKAYELDDCSEIMAKVVGFERKVAVKERLVTGNEIKGRVETGSLPIGNYGMEVVFVNGSGIKKRILQHGVISIASCNDAAGVQEDSCIVNLYVDKETSGSGPESIDYSLLENKPSINGVELVGDRSGAELGLVGSQTVASVVTMSEAEYDALKEKDPATLYVIIKAEDDET